VLATGAVLLVVDNMSSFQLAALSTTRSSPNIAVDSKTLHLASAEDCVSLVNRETSSRSFASKVNNEWRCERRGDIWDFYPAQGDIPSISFSVQQVLISRPPNVTIQVRLSDTDVFSGEVTGKPTDTWNFVSTDAKGKAERILDKDVPEAEKSFAQLAVGLAQHIRGLPNRPVLGGNAATQQSSKLPTSGAPDPL